MVSLPWFLRPAPYRTGLEDASAMTKDQIRRECARLQSVLDAYEAKAVATSVPDHHSGLRQRLEAMEQKLKAMDKL